MSDTKCASWLRGVGCCWLLCILLLGMSACDSGHTPPFGSLEAVVFGTVESNAGIPVPDAAVRILAHMDSCEAQPNRLGPVESKANGQFTSNIAFAFTPTIACLTIEAEAPPESGLRDTTFTVAPVELAFREESPFDSLRVDVTLPER